MADGDQHVLVVDDEAQIRQFVRAGMELGGYRVTEAANGGDALREITLHPIDLVILDLTMPVLSVHVPLFTRTSPTATTSTPAFHVCVPVLTAVEPVMS